MERDRELAALVTRMLPVPPSIELVIGDARQELEAQEPDGSWRRAYAFDGTPLVEPRAWFGRAELNQKSSTATAVPFLHELYRVTGEPRWRDAAVAAARFVAEHFVRRHPRVVEVLYPGRPAHPGHAIAARQMRGGFGAMLHIAINWARFEDMKRSYEMFARYVMPKFTGANAWREASLNWLGEHSVEFGNTRVAAAKSVPGWRTRLEVLQMATVRTRILKRPLRLSLTDAPASTRRRT